MTVSIRIAQNIEVPFWHRYCANPFVLFVEYMDSFEGNDKPRKPKPPFKNAIQQFNDSTVQQQKTLFLSKINRNRHPSKIVDFS